MGDITKDSKYGAGKSYKGQEAVLEGSLSGEIIIITKFAYDSAFNLEYLGEAKVGTTPTQNKWFLNKFIYDPAFNLIDIINATNIMTANASQVTVDKTSSNEYLIITLPLDGDFASVSPLIKNNTQQADVLNLTTPSQKIDCLPIFDTNGTDQVRIRKTDISATALAAIIDETASIATSDLTITLNNARTKDYNKRRWDLRERYTYA